LRIESSVPEDLEESIRRVIGAAIEDQRHLVENMLILELKAIEQISPMHEAQLLYQFSLSMVHEMASCPSWLQRWCLSSS